MKRSFESSNLESLFNRKQFKNDESNDFHILLETAYKEISRTSLKILSENYKLEEHFHGLRQYMLLGQGRLCQTSYGHIISTFGQTGQ